MSVGLPEFWPWLAGGALLLPVIIVLRRPLRRLLRLGVRSAVWLAALGALGKVGAAAGVTLGVNWVNALILGVLGVPGLGLLLMLNRMLG